jgi:uncharacterized phiE125 gp8 family phage protein
MAGILALTVASPLQTFTEPLSVTEVEMYLGLSAPSPADSAYTAELEMLIAAAREQAEIFQCRDLIEKQQDLTLDHFDSYAIQLRQPLSTVDLVRYRNSNGDYTTMVEGTDYIVDLVRGCILPPYGETWPTFTPWPSSAILIRFTCAAPSFLPKAVKVGMLRLISDWFNDRLPFSTGADAARGYPLRLQVLLAAGGRNEIA